LRHITNNAQLAGLLMH